MWTLRVSQNWIGTAGLVKAELRRSGKSPRTAGGSMRSDTRLPVIINDDGRLMDGGHRLARALIEGRKYGQGGKICGDARAR